MLEYTTFIKFSTKLIRDILTTIIRLDNAHNCVILDFNHLQKMGKVRKDFRFIAHQVDLSTPSVVIYKGDVIIVLRESSN